MNREKERASGGGVRAERARDVARLSQIQAVERLIGEQHRLRRQQADGQQHALALPLRQRPDRRIQQRHEVQLWDDVGPRFRHRPSEKAGSEVERPPDRLRRPGCDAVGHVKEDGGPRAGRNNAIVVSQRAAVSRQHAGEALEQRRLPRSVRSDQTEDFARPDRKRHVGQRGEIPVPFGETGGLERQQPECIGRVWITTRGRTLWQSLFPTPPLDDDRPRVAQLVANSIFGAAVIPVVHGSAVEPLSKPAEVDRLGPPQRGPLHAEAEYKYGARDSAPIP